MDSVTVQTISMSLLIGFGLQAVRVYLYYVLFVLACFRELCALCWMLHARDQLTISCRRYQSVRNQKDSQVQ